MKLLTQIFHRPNLLLDGKTVTREAVRAIVLKGDSVLMVFSKLNGDYKFPGGGVKKGETQKSALQRELMEECGAQLRAILSEFGKVEEYDLPEDDIYDIFKMTSYYYICQVDEEFGRQNLDDYESEYGFTPEWVPIKQAIAVNHKLIENPSPTIQRWVKRELFVLKTIPESKIL